MTRSASLVVPSSKRSLALASTVIEINQAFVQVNAIQSGRGRQNRLQIRAMNPHVGRAEALTVRRAYFMFANEPSVAPIPVNQVGYLGPARSQVSVVSGFSRTRT